jgi:uncharacterized protein
MNRKIALKALASHAAALKERGAASAYVFGSTVRGEETEASDLDIFIDIVPNKKFSLIDLAGIQNYLERELKIPVDVTTRGSLNPRLKSAIEREAIRAY